MHLRRSEALARTDACGGRVVPRTPRAKRAAAGPVGDGVARAVRAVRATEIGGAGDEMAARPGAVMANVKFAGPLPAARARMAAEQMAPGKINGAAAVLRWLIDIIVIVLPCRIGAVGSDDPFDALDATALVGNPHATFRPWSAFERPSIHALQRQSHIAAHPRVVRAGIRRTTRSAWCSAAHPVEHPAAAFLGRARR